MKNLLSVTLFSIFFLGLQAQEPQLVLPIGHHNSFGDIFISPKGNLVATTGFKEKMIAVWDVKSGKLLATFYDTLVYSHFDTIQFSNDGKKMYSAGGSRMIWDIEKKKLILDLYDEEESSFKEMHALFNPAGTAFAYSEESVLSIIDLNTKTTTTLKKNTDNITSIFYSPDGKYFAFTTNKQLFVLNTTDYSTALNIDYKGIVSFTSDNKLLLYKANHIQLLDLATGKEINTIPCPAPYLIKIDTGSKKMLLLTGTTRLPKWMLFDIKTATLLKQWEYGTAAGFCPDQERVFIVKESGPPPGQEDGPIDTYSKIEIWNAVTRQPEKTWQLPLGLIISDDGSRMAAVNGGSINIFNPQTGTLLRKWPWLGHIPWPSGSLLTKSGTMVGLTDYVNIWDIKGGRLLNSAFIGEDPDYFDDNIRMETDGAGEKAFIIKAGRWQVWDVKDARLLLKSPGIFKGSLKGAISKDGTLAVFLYQTEQKGYLELYDLRQLKRIGKFPSPANPAGGVGFTPDNSKLLISYSEKEQTEIRLRSNYSLVKTIKGIFENKFSFDGKKMVTSDADKKQSYIWETGSGNQWRVLEGDCNFHPGMNQLVTSTGKIIDLEKKDEVLLYNFNEYYRNSLNFIGANLNEVYYSTDGKKIIGSLVSIGSGGEFPSIYIWDAATRRLLQEPDTVFGYNDFTSASANKVLHVGDEMKVVGTEKKDTIILEGSRQAKSAGYAEFSDDDQFLFTAADQTIQKWDLSTGRLLFTFFPVDSTGYLTRIPNGYYSCTPSAARVLHYVKGMQVISFEQSDIRYNRPDKVLEYINYSDTSLIYAYRKAYMKRLTKLNVDTSHFASGVKVPEADFINRNEIPDEQSIDLLTLHCHATDSIFSLDKINIWVNEVPLFGSKGISLSARQINNFDTTITIRLNRGENRIEMSVTNRSGIESYRSPLMIKYIPAAKDKIEEKLHFIGIGINKFRQSDYNLSWSVKDIRDLAQGFKKKYGNKCSVDTLFNEIVTLENIRSLKESLCKDGINDIAIIAYSGHGMLTKDFDYYLSTYSVNFDKPEQNGLPYEELENLLDSIPARKKLMLIDACHSGEVDKEDLVAINKGADALKLKKGVTPVAYAGEGHLGLKNSFELMQSLFVNVGKSTGATIISAAAGTQFALERNDLKNGVFTYSILEAMNKYPTLKISELKKIVGARVEELTKGLQKPTSRNETIAVDWSIW